MNHKKATTFKWPLYHFLRLIVGPFFLLKYPLKIKDSSLIKEMNPPFLIIPNHTMEWDSILITIILKRPVHFMASESHFRKPIIAKLFPLVGAFPKAKASNDMSAIRHMMDLKKEKQVIGIFPEGQLSWDGESLPPIESTAKLIKLLKIPVYTCSCKGGYGILPRWGKKSRRGKMLFQIDKMYQTPTEIKEKTVEQIIQDLKKNLQYSDVQWIKKNGSYNSSSRAEYLENILYLCPHCLSLDSLYSYKNTLTCKKCSHIWTLNSKYEFQEDKECLNFFITPSQWNRWQKKALSQKINDYKKTPSDDPLFKNEYLTINTGFRKKPLKVWTKEGSLAFKQNHLELSCKKTKKTLLFPLSEIYGVHVMTRQKLELYHKGTLYTFNFPSLRDSGYKWLCALRLEGVPSTSAWTDDKL